VGAEDEVVVAERQGEDDRLKGSMPSGMSRALQKP
jgi:hypothetical protein